MNIKKISILLGVILSLVLLLGSTGSNRKLQDLKCQGEPGAWRQTLSEYTIIRASKLNELQNEVNEKLKESWHPIGGISIVDSNCCQVMVK